MSKIVLIILCSIFAINAQNSNTVNQICKLQNQQLLKTLDSDSVLRSALERNQSGDGISQPWMSEMKASNVKQATATIDFKYSGQELKLTLESMSFYNRYYYFSPEARIKNNKDNDKYLSERLKFPFFKEALEIIEVFKLGNKSNGRLYLYLLDDPCVPVIYDTNTVELAILSKNLNSGFSIEPSIMR